MDKWNLLIDIALCQNCNNCLLATKDELVGNHFPGYSAPHAAQGPGVLRMERTVRGTGHNVEVAHMPVMCNHCDDAPCIKAAAGAIRKRADGIVIIDPQQAKGRRDLVESCPYGAIVWNEAEQLPQHWFFDAHLLDQGWQAPRCVDVCPTHAIEAIKLSDAAMAERAQRDDLRVRQPELGTRPRVYYRHLDRVDRAFVAGSVVAMRAGQLECVAGAKIGLLQAGRAIGHTLSDDFGDFKFDGLEPGMGAVQVAIEHPEHGRQVCNAELGNDSVVLGTIELQGASERSL